MTRRPLVEGSETLSVKELMMAFESLGENVEFGFAQRACGAEPLGLFRFLNIETSVLISVLRDDMAGFLTEDDLHFSIEVNSDQYFGHSRRFPDRVNYQTMISPKHVPEAVLRSKELRRLAYLKDRLRTDLEDGRKILVRKGSDGLPAIRDLDRELKRLGPNVLLVVAKADIDHPPGTVESLGEGLFRGYVGDFKVCLKTKPMDLAAWVSVCRTVYRMVRSNDADTVPKRITSGHHWSGREPMVLSQSVATDESLPGRGTCRLTQRCDTNFAFLASFDVDPSDILQEGPILFRAAVWIPATFSGSHIDLYLCDGTMLHNHPADLSRRDCWQETWFTVLGPWTSRRCTVGVRSKASEGASFVLGEWSVASGAIPDEASLGEKRSGRGTAKGGMRLSLSRLRERAARAIGKTSRRRDVFGSAFKDLLAGPREGIEEAANAMIARGAFVEADDLLSLALETSPRDAVLFKLYAVSAHNNGRFADGIRRWNVARTLAPHDPMCTAALAANLREHVDLAGADAIIADGLQRFPTDGTILSEAARIAAARRRPEEAIALLDRAIGLHGDYPPWLTHRDRLREHISRRDVAAAP